MDHIRLPDGRHLGFATYGDTRGTPVLHCHGFPGSRFEGAMWHEIAGKHHIRLIVPERPGVGLSSFQKNRRIQDWPQDATVLLRHLGVDEFHLLGTSGGSAYVLACLHELPEHRIRGAAIVSGFYPLALGAEDMLMVSRIMVFLAVWATSLMAGLVYLVLGRAAQARDPEVFTKAFSKDVDMRPEIDRASLGDEQYKKKFFSSAREGIRANSYAFAWEARLLGSDWGFSLHNVPAAKLSLWHGKMDTGNPVSMTKRAGMQLTGSKVRVLDEGHISLQARHMEEIFEDLLQKA